MVISKKNGQARILGTPNEVEDVAVKIADFIREDSYKDAMESFSALLPPDQVDVMGRLDREYQVELLSNLSPRNIGLVVEELPPNDVVKISEDIELYHLAQLLDETRPEKAADVLRELPSDQREEIIFSMKEAEEVASLVDYEDDDAGGLMSPEFLSLLESMKVSEAMTLVREVSKTSETEEVSYIFVVDTGNVLKGGLNLSRLVTADPSETISDVMFPNVISVSTDTDQEECSRIM